MNSSSGYREIEHTADWELEVWAADLSSLFEQAARGMYHLSGTQLNESPRLERRIKLQAVDTESLLVKFLSEILFFGQEESVAFDHFELVVNNNFLTARLTGGPLASLNKEIKAVTYHNLAIHQTKEGLKVNIVFDV